MFPPHTHTMKTQLSINFILNFPIILLAPRHQLDQIPPVVQFCKLWLLSCCSPAQRRMRQTP